MALLVKDRIEDDAREDEDDDPDERKEPESRAFAASGAGLGRVGVARRRGSPRQLVLAFEHLGLVLNLAFACHERLVPRPTDAGNSLAMDDADVRKSAEAAVEVEPVADVELVGDGEADVPER